MDLYSIRRKNNSSIKGSIFPLISQLAPDEGSGGSVSSQFCVFRGVLRENRVIVTDPDHMKDIYAGGFFGNGDCSQGEPRFDSANLKQATPGTSSVADPASTIAYGSNVKRELEETVDEEPENMVLSPEESYFLAFGLGVLSVKTEKGQELCLDELYACFEANDVLFPIRYVAYHHFRQKGWVVRSGLTVGADYLLYKDGPPFSHASFIVSVQTDEDDPEPSTPTLTERDIDALTRIAGTVSKSLLLCYVLRPPGINLKDPRGLKDMKVCEVITNRWDSK